MVLRCVTLPAHNIHTHTVIFLHGRASTANEVSDELWESHDRRGESLQHIFPSVKWVFPEADVIHAERWRENVHQWFDIWSLDDPDEKRHTQVAGLKENTPKLIRLLQAEAARVGLRNVVLAGISQGCAAAIHALLNYPGSDTAEPNDRLGAFVGISSWMSLGGSSVQDTRSALGLDGATPSDDIYRNTPVFLSHSANDNIMPIEQGRRLRDMLTTYGMDVTWKEYEKGEHWIYAPQGVDDIVDFLKSVGLRAK
ncbi:Uu.00g146630.m01.CDS01 [Anthostomella pinea]|uniref:Uu.00g146630.m01.CDS01 n=1 Tax=Anthostomella pinea TaxID=933095 RepID=A0AAI8VRB2_9PEZI|nr:Uu.00g146630.m01.CDS01 [Anthostomella pinea]